MTVSELRDCLKKFKGDAVIFFLTQSDKSGRPTAEGYIDSMKLIQSNESGSAIELCLETRPLKSKQRDSDSMA